MFIPARIDVELGRPIRFCMSENRWEQVNHVYKAVLSFFPQKENADKDYSSETNVKILSLPERLRNILQNLESISIITSQINVNSEIIKEHKAKSEIHASISSIKIDLNTSRKYLMQNSDVSKEIVNEIIGNLDFQELQIKTVYHSQMLQNFIKPFSFTGEGKISWLDWSKIPYLEFKIESEVLMVDIGPENLLCLMDIQAYLDDVVNDEYYENNDDNHLHKDSTKNLEEAPHDILYQDDLRAGVFQYVNIALEDPKPYQILFDKMGGTMVWCYPEPRTLTRVDIFPVPFVAASEMSMAYDDQTKDLVLCALQYYDTLRETFITYRQFELSESKFCQLDLPSFYEKQHIAVSSMWRVCIDYREENSVSGDSRLVISPAALAACMRVDSMFSVDLLPRIQVVVSLGQLQVTLINHLNVTGKNIPNKLSIFTIDPNTPNEHPFVTINVDNTYFRTHTWTGATHVQTGGQFHVYVLSYKYLTSNCLLEPVNVVVDFTLQKALGPGKPKCIDSQVILKPIYLHIHQSMIHTLNIAHECWNQAFTVVSDVSKGPDSTVMKKLPYVLMTNYLVCNDTTETVRFGQIGTDESLLLESRGMHLYCWRSHKVHPELQICIESSKWKWCDPIDLDKEGIQVSRFVITEFFF